MSQIEDRMTIAHLAHIYQHQFLILYHRILGLEVKMQQTVAGGNGIEELQQKARLTLVSATSIVEGGYHDVTLRSST